MNTISASAPRRAASTKVTTQSTAVSRLANMVAPRDHAGKGGWDNNDSIPLIAWFYAAVFAFVFLVVLPWLGRAVGY